MSVLRGLGVVFFFSAALLECGCIGLTYGIAPVSSASMVQLSREKLGCGLNVLWAGLAVNCVAVLVTYISRWPIRSRTSLTAARLQRVSVENRRHWTIPGKQNLSVNFVKTDKGCRYLKCGRKTEEQMEKHAWGGEGTGKRPCKINWIYQIQASKILRFTCKLEQRASKIIWL